MSGQKSLHLPRIEHFQPCLQGRHDKEPEVFLGAGQCELPGVPQPGLTGSEDSGTWRVFT